MTLLLANIKERHRITLIKADFQKNLPKDLITAVK